MKRVGLYAGSFDPITNGHLDIIKRSLFLFDEVIVAIGHNLAKKGHFNIPARRRLIHTAILDGGLQEVGSSKIQVVDYEDHLTTEFAKEVGATALIRGLRALTDFEYEMQFEHVCRSYEPDLQVVYLMTAPEHSYTSSSLVKQLASLGAPVDKFVPWCVVEAFGLHVPPEVQEEMAPRYHLNHYLFFNLPIPKDVFEQAVKDGELPADFDRENYMDPEFADNRSTDVEVPVPNPPRKAPVFDGGF